MHFGLLARPDIEHASHLLSELEVLAVRHVII